MTSDQILAIDVGTQSVRALVFDLRGGLVAHGTTRRHRRHRPDDPALDGRRDR